MKTYFNFCNLTKDSRVAAMQLLVEVCETYFEDFYAKEEWINIAKYDSAACQEFFEDTLDDIKKLADNSNKFKQMKSLLGNK